MYKYIFSRPQKTKKPKMTPANIYASIHAFPAGIFNDHINMVNILILYLCGTIWLRELLVAAGNISVSLGSPMGGKH